MKKKQNKILFVLFGILSGFSSVSWARESLVKDKTVVVSGYSWAESDYSTIYGGIAGTPCSSSDNTSTCNSCTNTTSLQACNQQSVYSGMAINISFQLTKDVSSAKGIVFVGDSGSTSSTALNPQTLTASAGSTVNFQIHWSDICSAGNLTSSCTCTSGAQLISKVISFGVDSDASGDVESEETKKVTVKLHCIPETTDPTAVSQAYCPTTATGYGVCNVVLKPGDQKAYIDSLIQAGADASTGSSIDWDAVAFFPVPVANGTSGATTATDEAAFTSFTSGQVAPILKSIATDGTVPDSKIEGSLENYNRYCFVYANRNKAQNIYRFVVDAAAAPTACLSPSEVVGLLDDKHCFISTAAFGSDMASEVQIFRQFRNQYLLTHNLGKKFVHFYYQVSPPVAEVIAQSDLLRTITRGFLYPLLGFSYIALHYGLAAALLTTFVMLILLSQLRRLFRMKKTGLMLMLAVLAFSSVLKANDKAEFESVPHPDSVDGLIKIKKDGTYVYDVKRAMKNQSSRLGLGAASHPEISIDIEELNAQGQSQGTKTFIFDDFYGGASNIIFSYGYEWFPWIEKGKLGLQGGVSLMYASGHGRLVASPNEPSVEKYTFLTVPLDLGIVYRLEWKDRQLLAPYAAGGGTYVGLVEKREDKNQPHFAGAPGFYGAAGILVNLSLLDDESGLALENEYGITNLWLSLEFKAVEVNGESFAFNNRYVSAGLAFDF